QVHGTVSHQHIYGLLFRVLWPLVAGRLIHPRRLRSWKARRYMARCPTSTSTACCSACCGHWSPAA
ncbi:hypothetical protein C7E25_24925, partial [Stenotrophomonas maltophilia]